ncbi:MAG TPA: cytochrome c biogenesis protein CcdA [Thermoplasmata archaeon]|nr:cytochrome c biogenesis protein CcdA [Thermoplasmata archaeon]
MVSRGKLAIVAVVAAVVVVVVVSGLYLTGTLGASKAKGSNQHLATDFTLTDIYGRNFTLSHFRDNSVVVVEFTALSCSECQIVEQSLQSLYSGYNATGTTHVQVVSIYIEPSFGDSIPKLQAYHTRNNITWTMAQDTPSLQVSSAYSVSDIPVVVVVDKPGHVVYDQSGAQSTPQVRSIINSALAGTAAPISIVTVSVFGLAAIAGLSTFFSPCAFPMFPGYMSLFLGLNASGAEAATGRSYKGAVRRALSAGSVSALGMMIVFLIIGVALILAASLVGAYIPFFLVVVGGVLVVLGLLLLTNLQYWKIVTPLQNLWRRIRGQPNGPEAASVVDPTTPYGKGFYVKLFSYGMGYAAAAAGCVAPVILAAIVAGLALGLLAGIVSILIFSLTGAFLMIAVTLIIATAGEKYVNQLKAYTPVIKKVSAAALLVVGVYLLYFYYTAWVR